jgi:hypothetical protein
MSEPNTDEGGSLISRIPSGLSRYLYDRAAAAIGHLVGAYAPKVLADSQAAKDERDARSAFVAALAKAASERATQNPELVDRMLTRLVGEEITKQENREAIAIAAIIRLGDYGLVVDNDNRDLSIEALPLPCRNTAMQNHPFRAKYSLYN